jgi:hypothetical protein
MHGATIKVKKNQPQLFVMPTKQKQTFVSEKLAVSVIYRDNGSIRSKHRAVFANLQEVRCRNALTFPFPL